jgi:hypothetical protein
MIFLMQLVFAAVAGYFIRGLMAEHQYIGKRLQQERADRLIASRKPWADALVEIRKYRFSLRSLSARPLAPPADREAMALMDEPLALEYLRLDSALQRERESLDGATDDPPVGSRAGAHEERAEKLEQFLMEALRQHDAKIGYTELRGPAAIPVHARSLWNWLTEDLKQEWRGYIANRRLRQVRRGREKRVAIIEARREAKRLREETI